ncbi:hypothetical protein [Cellulomonas palmilytica]|uniref:hypothetical protein n=1 Tax=Cellulomonas palmilytica TaxID=2608402 RepID=UPI001F32AEC8|nr:hypothetical protein [Cellulomonas palmilytica]UJP39783.1 hypothetical protein F1D97_16070 [Cellulomonas palmilytica]
MNCTADPPARLPWSRAVLTALITLCALVLAAGTASAATAPAPENRIRASSIAAQTLDRPPQDVSADQRLGNEPPRAEVVVATGVAANTAPRLLSPSSLADEVANATGGVLKTNKGGFTIDVPNGARGISVRVMERGGSRTNYYRVSVPGKETYTVTGEASTDAALTHMDIGESSLDDILSIIARIQGAG